MKSYLVSLRKQTIHLKKLDQIIEFEQNELIWTELSKKFNLEDIEKIASKTDFRIDTHFLDCKHYFTDTLWTKD